MYTLLVQLANVFRALARLLSRGRPIHARARSAVSCCDEPPELSGCYAGVFLAAIPSPS
jgi:hypothetical protein